MGDAFYLTDECQFLDVFQFLFSICCLSSYMDHGLAPNTYLMTGKNYNCRSSICFIKLFIAYSIQYCSSITGLVKEHGWRNLSSEKRSSQENSHGGIQSHNISKGASSNIQEGTSLVCLCFLWSKLHVCSLQFFSRLCH